MLDALLQRPVLKAGSYTHSLVYAVLLWGSITDRGSVVAVLGWAHGVGWIVMSALCLAAVRRRTIPLWLGVMVAVVGGVGPFAGSIAFMVEDRRRHALG